MNSVIISGRIVRDPELRTTDNGTEVCNFTVAVDRRRKDKDGNRSSDFIDFVAWGKSGVFVSTYFHKGDGIEILGRLESRKYTDKDGNNRVAWSVQADHIEFPKGKSSNGGSTDTATFSVKSTEAFTDVTTEDDGELPF